jgi:hypothetical protein
VNALAVVIALVLFAGCLALLCHPLLRFLKVPEVPAALLACVTGRLNRRRLAFILRSRRQAYLEDIACLLPGPLWIVLAWGAVHRRLAFAWRHGPLATPSREKILAVSCGRPAGVTVHEISDRDYNRSENREWHRSLATGHMTVAEVRERVGGNPWAVQVEAELARHRKGLR